MNLSVRKARMGDIRAIHALLMTSSADGLLLPRSLTDLYGHLRDFFVVEGDGATVGCGALSIIWENMAEVRSLAVAAHARRKVFGKIQWCFSFFCQSIRLPFYRVINHCHLFNRRLISTKQNFCFTIFFNLSFQTISRHNFKFRKFRC